MSETNPTYELESHDRAAVLGPEPDDYDTLLEKYTQQSIQLGRYRHALRVIAGLAPLPAEFILEDDYADKGMRELEGFALHALKQYNDHKTE